MLYVRTEEDPGSGKLEFQAPVTNFSHVMAIPFREASGPGVVFAQKQHRLLLFSLVLRHRALPCKGAVPRYLVSYDLVVTTAPGQGQEIPMPHLMDWVPLGSFSST